MSISSVASGVASNDDLLKKLVKYIPTEIIALYVAVLSIYEPIQRLTAADGTELEISASDFTSRWYLFIAMVVATPLISLLIFKLKVMNAAVPPTTLRWDKWAWASALAVLALAVWASVLPDSPAFDWDWWKSGIGAVVLLGGTLIIPPIATVLGVDEFS